MDTHLLHDKTSANPGSSELDFANHWVDRSVQGSILQGQKLQKLKEYKPKVIEEYVINNVDWNIRPFCEARGSRRKSTNATKKTKKKKSKKAAHRATKKSPESIKTDLNDDCICQTFKRKHKRKPKPRCPMRITELAVPTKRKCLESWQANYRILPAVMIDRLKQYVRDQQPVVQITDAIHCFQRAKKARKIKAKKDIKKKLKSIPKVDITSINLKDACTFCGVFGFKISQELNRPLVIKLNSELQRIANVVTMDIADILSRHKKYESIKSHARNQSMYDEISGKIAIWIWNILEESYHNILEDQLRDLDEELGPALDILDEIIDNVLDLCVPETLYVAMPYVYGEGTFSSDEEANDEDIDKKSELSIDIKDEMLNELNNILDSFIEDDVKNEEEVERQSDVRSQEDKENEFEDAVDLQARDEINDAMNRDGETYQEVKREDEIIEGHDDENDELKESNEDTQVEDENQVSDFSEDFHDDNDKKVTFEVDTVMDDLWGEESWKKHRRSYIEHSPEVHWPSLSEIKFSKPNDHILSEVDEVWPYDILKDETILRPSASINKSISSLGNIIYENDDTISVSRETSAHPSQEELHETELDSLQYKDRNSDIPSTKDDTFPKRYDNPLTKEDTFITKNTGNATTKDTSSEDKPTDTVNLKDANEHDFLSRGNAVQMSIDLSNLKQYKSKRTKTLPIRSKEDVKEHSKSVISHSSGDFGKKESEPITDLKKSRSNYKVHLSTAPSWVMRGIAETTKCPCLAKQPICQYRIQHWCNVLLIGFNNLELWNDWISDVSKLIKDVENKKATSCKTKYTQQHTKLREDIDADAKLWINQHRCIKKHIGEYQDIYRKPTTYRIKSTKKPCFCIKKPKKS